MTSLLRIAAAATLLVTVASGARADVLCAAPPPAPGAVVRGPVLHVRDGETLCVALGATPDLWLPMRLAQTTPGPPALAPSPTRGALMSVAFGEMVDCRLESVTPQGAIATCTHQGRSIAQAARDPAALAAGRAWR